MLPVQGAGFDSWSENWIPHATVKDQRSRVLKLRPGAAKDFFFLSLSNTTTDFG